MKGLVLDGGGVFGIAQAHILSRVDVSKFDFFAGTSIGAVLAIACVSGMDLTKLPFFFHECMPIIFKTNLFHKYNIFNSEYSDKGLTKVLSEIIPDMSFGELSKPVFIPVSKLKGSRLKVFSSLDETDSWWPLWEILRMATAAQTYFNPWKGYADGGVFANNPSMVSIASASKILGCNINDIELCSIGTGSNSLPIEQGIDNYSLFSWGRWLIRTLISGSSNSMHEYFASSLPLAKYNRIEFKRKKGWKLDSVKNMLLAEKEWEEEINAAVAIVENF